MNQTLASLNQTPGTIEIDCGIIESGSGILAADPSIIEVGIRTIQIDPRGKLVFLGPPLMTYLTALDCVRFATLLGTLMPGRVREVRELSRGVGWLERSCPGGVGRCGAAFCMQRDRTRVTLMAMVSRPLVL